MESIYQIFKEVFADQPINPFEISKDLVLFIFHSVYLVSFVALVGGAILGRWLRSKKDDNYFIFVLRVVSLVLIIIPAISFLFIKDSYLDRVVERQFLPKLTTEQVELLERRHNYYIGSGEFKNKATKKQRLGLEEKPLKLSFCELSIILMQETNGKVDKSCLWVTL